MFNVLNYFKYFNSKKLRYFAYDRLRKDTIRAYLSYDSVYKRERIIDEFTLGSQDDFFDSLYLHNQNVEYKYNFKTKVCVKSALTRYFFN